MENLAIKIENNIIKIVEYYKSLGVCEYKTCIYGNCLNCRNAHESKFDYLCIYNNKIECLDYSLINKYNIRIITLPSKQVTDASNQNENTHEKINEMLNQINFIITEIKEELNKLT